MDERDKRKVGEQLEPGGRPKAPGRLGLLQRFLNTWNHEFPTAWDRIGTPERAGAWLSRTGLLPRGAPVSVRDVARLRELRESIRALAAANGGAPVPSPAAASIAREAATAWLRVELDPGGATSLRPRSGGVDGAVASLLAILHESRLRGEWVRLKACRQCRYVFFDRSKNRSAAWCAMSICGNRTKNRAYRRRRSASIAADPARSFAAGIRSGA